MEEKGRQQRITQEAVVVAPAMVHTGSNDAETGTQWASGVAHNRRAKEVVAVAAAQDSQAVRV